jgi:hypothetical protein
MCLSNAWEKECDYTAAQAGKGIVAPGCDLAASLQFRHQRQTQCASAISLRLVQALQATAITTQ